MRRRPLRLALLVLVATTGLAGASALGGPAAAGDKRTLTGTLVESHGDDLGAGAARVGWALRTSRGTLALEGLDATTARALRGKAVKVTGRDNGNGRFAADRGGVAAMDGSSAAGTGSTVPSGPKGLAVILVNFTDDNRYPFTPEQVHSTVFSGTTSVSSYYEDVSDGAVTVVGDVYGWYTVRRNTAATCDFGAWGSAARDAATASGVDLSAYSYFAYVWPMQSTCRWGGMGELPGSQSWINGYNNVATFGHELGHNFGVHHAGALRCISSSGAPVVWSDSCALREYGDPFSIMGNLGTRLQHNSARAHYGFLSPYTVPAGGGTYTLVPADDATSTAGPRLLRIARSDGSHLALEFRQPAGPFDNFLGTDPVVNGVSLRVESGNGWTLTKLLDATPSTSTFSDAALPVGGSFSDPLSGATVTVESVSSSGAVVTIAGGSVGTTSTGDTAAPTPVPLLSAYATRIGVVRVSWSMASDNVGVVGYLLQRTGASERVVQGHSLTENLDAGGYTYSVSAMDAAGNIGPAKSVRVYV